MKLSGLILTTLMLIYSISFGQTAKVKTNEILSARELNLRSIEKFKAKNFQGALEDLNKAIQIKPTGEYYFNRATTKNAMENCMEGIEDFHKAIELKYRLAEAYFEIGHCKNGYGENEEAITNYSHAIEINTIYAEAYNARAFAYASIFKFEEALEDLNKAIQLKPDYSIAYNNRGFVNENLKDLKAACNDWQKAADLGSEESKEFITIYCNQSNQAIDKKDVEITPQLKAIAQQKKNFAESNGFEQYIYGTSIKKYKNFRLVPSKEAYQQYISIIPTKYKGIQIDSTLLSFTNDKLYMIQLFISDSLRDAMTTNIESLYGPKSDMLSEEDSYVWSGYNSHKKEISIFPVSDNVYTVFLKNSDYKANIPDEYLDEIYRLVKSQIDSIKKSEK